MSSKKDISVTSLYSEAFELAKSNFWKLLGITFIVGIITSLPSILFSNNPEILNSISSFYSLLVGGPLSAGMVWVYILASRKMEFDFNDITKAFKENYAAVIVGNILTGVSIMLGLILFIFPGLYIAFRLSFVNHLIVDKNLSGIDAVKKSWEITDGNVMTIFMFGLYAFFIIVVGLLALIVGVFFAAVVVSLASALLYNRLIEDESVIEKTVEEVKEVTSEVIEKN